MAVRLILPRLRSSSNSWRFVSSSSTWPLNNIGLDDDEYDQSKADFSVSEKLHLRSDDLRIRLLRIIFPPQSATTVLQSWVDEGRKVSMPELRRITKQLTRRRRFNHALEILNWVEAQTRFQILAADHAIKLELIIKVHGLREAEEYFGNISDITSRKASCLPLLHFYVKERATEKAEALMLTMNGLGSMVSPHPYNEMMKLYMATSQFEKVPFVILHMKQNKIPRNVLSYNLWMNACGEISGFASAEMVCKEMVNDNFVEVGWSSLATMANIYLKSGLLDRANFVLKTAERKLSTCNRLGYFFIITLHTSLNNKDAVLRLWEASKAVHGKMTCANYMCILSCLVKMGDIEAAEILFMEWESQCRKYDARVVNILLGAYLRNGLVEKAEALHLHTLERGGCPNYKTWEILMEGWVKTQDMDKAVDAMKKGFSMLKHCDWKPSPSTVLAFAEYFEKQRNFKDARWYLEVIRRLGCVSLPVYRSLLRMHICDEKPTEDIFRMMQEDGISLDDETSTLVQGLMQKSKQ